MQLCLSQAWAQIRGGGGTGNMSPHYFEGGGHNIKCLSPPPPPPLFLGWMIINWNEDPFYMFSDVVDFFFSFFFACQKGLWCTMGTPTLCLENWAKMLSRKKSVGVSPPPPPPPLIGFFWTCATFRGWRPFLFFYSPPPPCHRGLWCTMGTPNLCLETWAKNVESEKKVSRPSRLAADRKKTVCPPPPPPMIRFGFAPLVSGRLNALLVSEH